MRSRAYRRHKRAVKLARRRRIIRAVASSWEPRDAGRVMGAHLNCNCFDEPRAQAVRRRREEREWRAAMDL